MRLTGSRAYYRTTPPKMPPGLVELIEGLTREVLKNNPTDVNGFCAAHMKQLLEIRDGPIRKKTLTLQDKIAKAQAKVRQRAEQRRQENNDLPNQQSGQASGINVPAIKDDTSSVLSQKPAAAHIPKTPIQNEQELAKTAEATLSPELCTPSEDPQPKDTKELAIEDAELKNDIKTEPMGKEHVSKDNNNLAESCNKTNDSVLTQDLTINDPPKIETPATKVEVLDNLGAPMADRQITDGEKQSLKAVQTVVAEASVLQEFDDVAPNTDQNVLSPIDSINATQDVGLVDTGEKTTAILTEAEKTADTQSSLIDSINATQDVGLVDTGEKITAILTEAEKTADTQSSLIDSINATQDVGLVDTGEKITAILTEAEKTADPDIYDHNSPTQAANVISKDITETQCDNINLPLDKQGSQESNDTESMQHLIDPHITNRSNIDSVDLTTNSDDNVNGKEEDSQETNTFDISFKESPTVELQDPQINSDMLESLLESNSDSDIVTLITQESTTDELKQCNGFKHDIGNSDLPKGKKHNSESNGVILTREELQENNKNQINNTVLIDNNKENTQIENGSHEYISTILNENSHIHNQDSNMDLETAAVTIQKVFRTFLFKSRASTFEDTVNDETMFLNEDDKNKEDCNFPIAGNLNKGRPHGITRMDTVLQTVNEEKSLSLSTDDSSTLSSAATVIQAHVRGFLVRNKLNSNKTISTNSLAASNSNEPSLTSLEMDNEQSKNKTVLNIHIVPEGGNYLSRDESLITSMDLSLDSSPPSSINLHPLGYDKSERRKQLKREDAIQSVSPPSNNSGKLSEDVDSVKELPLNDFEGTEEHQSENKNVAKDDLHAGTSLEEDKKIHVENMPLGKVISDNAEPVVEQKESEEKTNSDEMDVVSPFISNEDNKLSEQRLLHSGEFHDAVLPTKVSRSDTSVTSEFKNVLVYFLLWNHS